MSALVVRAARADEAGAVLEMYEWLFEPPGHRPAAWDAERARRALARAIDGPASVVLVAENDAAGLVGLAAAYLDLDSVRYGMRCWVEDLVVDPTYRSLGVGRALLDTAKDWARAQGATHLELDTGLARADAQRFYEREEPATTGYSYSWFL